VPDRCELLIDRRFTPSETAEQTEREIREVIDQLKKEDSAFNAEMHLHPTDWNELSIAPVDSEIVKSIQRVAERLTGKAPKPVGGSHSSDHGWWTSRYHKPFASYGIGGSGGHMANEFAGVEDVIKTTKVYALLMLDLLGTE
jgi:succinyl-diaminopimelate desuccinylase